MILLLLRISAIILFCFIQPCFFFSISYAGPVREVIVEWEPIRDAVSYDVEFLNEKDNTVVLKLDEIRQANCKASLAPGSYQVRVRSRDDRGLSGRWGDPQIVMVPDFPIVLKSPADGESIQAENNIGIVTLEWEFSRASGSFPVEIQVFALRLGMSSGVGERPIFSTTTSGQSATIELPVGSSYEARFSSKGSTKSELAKVRFQIVGLPLEAPQIKQIVDENRQLLTFSRPEGAEAISVQIQGLDQKDGQFKLLAELKLKDQLKLSLNELPSNRPLLIQARAESAIRASSASQTFFLDKSVTSQRALNEVKPNVFRRSASTNLFARYNLSSADYFSRSFEKSSISTSSGITGTLALGGGKFHESGIHGVSSQFEFGGITVENSNYTFVRAQVNYIFRKSLSLPLELRGGLGFRYASLPEINKLSNNSISSGSTWSVGPNFNLDFWYQLRSRIAIQTEISIALPVFGEASNNAKIKSGISYQYSIKFAYSWSPEIIASAGLIGSEEILTSPGKNPVGNLTGENQQKLSSLGAVASLEWSLP